MRIASGASMSPASNKDPVVNLATAKQLVVLQHGIGTPTPEKSSASAEGFQAQSSGANTRREVRVTGKKRGDLSGRPSRSWQVAIRPAAAFKIFATS